MKRVLVLLSYQLLILLISPVSYSQEGVSVVQPFLPEIVSQFPNVRDVTVSLDENEIYFTAQSFLGELSAIVFIRKKNGKWSAPAVAPFSGRYQDLEAFLSPDNLRLYFASNRPSDHNTDTLKPDYDIWYVERLTVNSNWAEPVNVGSPVNTKEHEFYPTISKHGNLCYTSDGVNSKGKDDIFISRLEKGKFQTPVSISDSINTTGYEFNAFIAPDESYLIFTCYNKPDGYGSGDLYISYNKSPGAGTGNWTVPENLGKEFNSAQMDYCPFVNGKTNILYFTSKRTSLDTTPARARNLNELLNEMNKYENGQSRLYFKRLDTVNSFNTKNR